jgi:hypothetical protein
MGQSQEKGGFFKKVINIIVGNPSPTPKGTTEAPGKYEPQDEESLDLRFVKNFTKSGGHFLYCKDLEELKGNIESVCLEENAKFVYTVEDDIKEVLKGLSVEVQSKANQSQAICSNCEALIAQIGGIMIDDIQTGGIVLKELPEVHIIIAKTSQIVENLHAGMAKINNKYKSNRPGQLTTLKGSQDESVRQASNDQNAKRVLYLLLVEDQVK